METISTINSMFIQLPGIMQISLVCLSAVMPIPFVYRIYQFFVKTKTTWIVCQSRDDAEMVFSYWNRTGSIETVRPNDRIYYDPRGEYCNVNCYDKLSSEYLKANFIRYY